MHKNIKFFLGANSNMDFVSYFEQLQGAFLPTQLLILKGGPGSGKSTLMKRVLSYAQNLNHDIEIIPCASDPLSLDAVIDKTANFAIMDGTSPHAMDPRLPGALHHIVNMGRSWDCKLLEKNREEIDTLNTRVGDYHKAAGAYIKSASALLRENMRYSKKYINKAFCEEFIKDALEKLSCAPFGDEATRLLSAVSVGSIKAFPETINSLADKIYVFDDKWGSGADYILKALLFHARIFGIQVIHCPCPVSPQKTEHLIFPGIKTAFCTALPGFSFSSAQTISQEALYLPMEDSILLNMRFDDAARLLASASAMVKEAKLLHDKLESFYAKAMDFSKTDFIFEDILDRFYR